MSFFLFIPIIFLIVTIILLVITRLALIKITIESTSMVPTLKPRDKVLVLRYWPSAWLRKGHIVIVSPWKSLDKTKAIPKDTSLYIKRIVAISGETLVTSIDQLDTINRSREARNHNSQGLRTWHIPSKKIFVKGDHPIGGFDSLSWGPIHVSCVEGIVIRNLTRQRNQPESNNSQELLPVETGPKIGEIVPYFEAFTHQKEVLTPDTFCGQFTAFYFFEPNITNLEKGNFEKKLLEVKNSGFELVVICIGENNYTHKVLEINKLNSIMAAFIADKLNFLVKFNYAKLPAYCLVDNAKRVIAAGQLLKE